MRLRRIFTTLFSKTKLKASDESMVSIVLLLREPETLLQWEYAAAIEKTWGWSEENHAVVQGPLALLRIDANLVHAVCGSCPYWPSKKDLPKWAYHEAFVSVDHMSPKLVHEARYAVIARLVLALLTENCVGAFSPALGGLVQNDESLTELLRAMADSYKVGG